MDKLVFTGFYVGDRLKGPKHRRTSGKFNRQSSYRRRNLYFARLNADLDDSIYRVIPQRIIDASTDSKNT